MESRKKACIAIIISLAAERRVVRRCWMKKWLEKRDQYTHVRLLREISISDEEDFRNYFRMNKETYEKLLKMVQPHIFRQDTVMRRCISAHERLAVTLRYLATGRNFEDLKFSAIISPASISTAIVETCEVFIYVLQEYMKFPNTPQEWQNLSKDFGMLHGFYNCVGSIDGKHIAIHKPEHSGALYYNYKGFYSIVLAVANARKEFIMVDAGMNGRISDGGVFYYSKFGELLKENKLNLPDPAPLPGTSDKFPFVFVADEAFALDVNVMKPYALKALDKNRLVYNEKLSRARVTIENAFGILASRFGVFQKPIYLSPEKSAIVTMAACYLHNFLAQENPDYFHINCCEESCDRTIPSVKSTLSRNSTTNAKEIREKYCSYFNHADNK
ncbi:putative nuclease HARBI1 isoform X1 [Topomyia yanbarensis]|uniref:putative nuclease HARBI1 isoform X1 n=1 Tax=Topomyia yanbarensis TaxID=2498891 RepID=UPI00273B63C6|nr:putative nuclease HARBI1 isoform X1 [Topomyia yanbarensis]